MNTILYIGFIFGIFYVLTITIFIIGFLKTKTYKLSNKLIDSELFISVIIPFKNEAEHIAATAKSLIEQNLATSKFELIFVNDYSDDLSYEILQKIADKSKNIRILTNSLTPGKKFALRTGIEHANGSVIVMTDADCTSLPNRLSIIYNYFAEFRPKFLILPVFFSGNSVFEKMQALDFLSLTASGYGAAGIERPILCNGANLAFEKSVFWEFQNDFRYDIPSGDDMFLLQAVKKKYRNQIKFLKSTDCAVVTPAEPSLRKLFSQRTRWAAKTKYFRDKDTLIVAFIVLIFNMYLPFGIWFSVSEENLSFAIPIFVKFFIDFVFLSINAFYFKQLSLLWHFPSTWVANFIFSVFIAFRSFVKKTKNL